MATKQKQDKIEYSHILNKSVLELNDGQLEGLPKNPRYIKDEKFAKLKLSLQQSPEFLKARPLLVYPLDNGHFIIVGGNMRFLAGNEVGIEDYPCYIFPKETTTDKLKEYVIKDNVAYGSTDWDALANDDWNVDDLQDWGVDCNFLTDDVLEDPLKDTPDLNEDTYKEPEKDYLECPFCHHVDSKVHFKKVEAPEHNEGEEIQKGTEEAEAEEVKDENLS